MKGGAALKLRVNVPNITGGGCCFFFVETSVSSQTSKATFEIVDQGARGVCLDPTSSDTRTEMGVMVDK